MAKFLAASLGLLCWSLSFLASIGLGANPGPAVIALTVSVAVIMFLSTQTLNVRRQNPLLRVGIIALMGLTPAAIVYAVSWWNQNSFWVDFWLIASIVLTFISWTGLYLQANVTPFSHQSYHGPINGRHSYSPMSAGRILLATGFGVGLATISWSAVSGIPGLLWIVGLVCLYSLYEWHFVRVPAELNSIGVNNFVETVWMVLRPLLHQAYALGVASSLGWGTWGTHLFLGVSMIAFCLAERIYRT